MTRKVVSQALDQIQKYLKGLKTQSMNQVDMTGKMDKMIHAIISRFKIYR